MIIQKAGPVDFPIIAQLIVDQCQNPATQCIHSSTGEDAITILGEIEKWHQTDEILFIAARQDDKLIGVMGCEFDLVDGRGWLRGPFTVQNWERVAPPLYNLLLQSIPDPICRLDTFLNIHNTRGHAFYLERGFTQEDIGHTYTAQLPEKLLTPGEGCVPLGSEHQAGFVNLHDQIFPETYYNGEQIVNQLDENHKVFVYAKKGEIFGYAYIIAESWADEGYLEFLGVRESARRRGIGAKLLASALYWAFSSMQVPQVGLTVTDANVNARGLYERAGFNLKYTGVNTRLILNTNKN